MLSINKQIVVTAIALIFTVVLFDVSDIDIWTQDCFYNFQTHAWLVDKNEAVAKLIFYDGIKRLYYVLIIVVFVALYFSKKRDFLKAYREGLIIVAISTIAVPVVVGALKATTNVPCPKSIEHYGGDYPHVTVLKAYPEEFAQKKRVKCYPAGHASGGFALLSLMFLFKSRKSKVLTFFAVMGVSWSIGIYKMVIGDHFLSHTVVTMVLAWLIVLVTAKFVLHKK